MFETRAFIDTAIFIYVLEKNEHYYDAILNWITERFGKTQFITSVLTRMEYSVMPFKIERYDLLENYDFFLRELSIETKLITNEVAISAAKYRAKYEHLKAMDALQIACATQNDCNIFLSNDNRLKRVAEIQVKTIEELKNNAQ